MESVFSCEEMVELLEALKSISLVRSRAGARHAMHNQSVAAFARDPRLLGLARSVLGPIALPYRATLFDKSSTANWLVAWHQDTALPLLKRDEKPGWGPWSVKGGVVYARAPADVLGKVLALRVHLDDCTKLNGPLRVLPGTHRHGVLTDERTTVLAREVMPVECAAVRGGVLAMRPLLVHASSKSQCDVPRRVLHIEYAASMEIEPGVELAVA